MRGGGYYAREIMFGIGQYNSQNNTVKVASWDIYDLSACEKIYYDGTPTEYYTETTIDLSKLNTKKDNYIAVKTNLTDPIYIKIPASVQGQKITYTGIEDTDGRFEIKNVKGDKGTNYKWEYRTKYGQWQKLHTSVDSSGNYSAFDTDLGRYYHKNGASLYIRAASNDTNDNHSYVNGITQYDGHITKTGTTVKDANDKSADPVEYPLYIASYFPGKESKVNIPKMAKGPSVAVDYINNKVKLPKNVEFRVLAGSDFYADIRDYKDISAGSTVDVEKFLENTWIVKEMEENYSGEVSGVLEVRKKADVSKRKGVSKWTVVDITYPTEMAIKADDASLSKLKDGAIAASEAAFNVSGGAVTVKYVYDGKGRYKNKVNITNGGKMSYQVVIKSGVPAASDKATLIKANSTKAIKANKGDSIYIRVAGNRKEKIFAGKYTFVAKTNY